MRYGSLFSGIGGFDLGFDQAGMECAWQVEQDKYCLPTLRRHWLDVPKYKDVKNVGKENLESVDLICGGFPCQDVSIAGNRAGLAGERSGLWFEYLRVITELEPTWVVIENVPGLLSSWSPIEPSPFEIPTRDFDTKEEAKEWASKIQGEWIVEEENNLETILFALEEFGYQWVYRIVDSQYYGVPQRRQRVFIVGYLRKGCPAEVLFEPESSPWDTPPSRETGQGTTRNTQRGVGISGEEVGFALRANPSHSGDKGDGGVNTNFVVAAGLESDVPTSLSSKNHRNDLESETFVVEGCLTPWDAGPKRIHGGPIMPTLVGSDGKGGQRMPYVAFQQNTRDEVRLVNSDGQIVGALPAQPGMKQQNYLAFAPQAGGNTGLNIEEDKSGTLQENQGLAVCGIVDGYGGGADDNDAQSNRLVKGAFGVRRLTPLECERLQGFPDGWTEYGLSENGELVAQSDTQRYRQLGNAVTVSVARWLGRRIVELC